MVHLTLSSSRRMQQPPWIWLVPLRKGSLCSAGTTCVAPTEPLLATLVAQVGPLGVQFNLKLLDHAMGLISSASGSSSCSVTNDLKVHRVEPNYKEGQQQLLQSPMRTQAR